MLILVLKPMKNIKGQNGHMEKLAINHIDFFRKKLRVRIDIKLTLRSNVSCNIGKRHILIDLVHLYPEYEPNERIDDSKDIFGFFMELQFFIIKNLTHPK